MYKGLTYFYFLILLAGLELSIFKPDFFWWVFPINLFLNIVLIWLAVRKRFNVNFFNYLISPWLFLLAGMLFLGFANNLIIKQILILFLAAANTIFIYRLVIFTYYKYLYKEHSLSTISRILNLSTIFFWFTSSFDLYSFLKISNWLLMLAGVIITYLVTYQFFCISKIKNINRNLFILTTTGVLLELFYIISWLPLISVARSMLLVSAYYFITSLTKHETEGTLAKSVYLRYSVVTLLIWILVLTTARWE